MEKCDQLLKGLKHLLIKERVLSKKLKSDTTTSLQKKAYRQQYDDIMDQLSVYMSEINKLENCSKRIQKLQRST